MTGTTATAGTAGTAGLCSHQEAPSTSQAARPRTTAPAPPHLQKRYRFAEAVVGMRCLLRGGAALAAAAARPSFVQVWRLAGGCPCSAASCCRCCPACAAAGQRRPPAVSVGAHLQQPGLRALKQAVASVLRPLNGVGVERGAVQAGVVAPEAQQAQQAQQGRAEPRRQPVAAAGRGRGGTQWVASGSGPAAPCLWHRLTTSGRLPPAPPTCPPHPRPPPELHHAAAQDEGAGEAGAALPRLLVTCAHAAARQLAIAQAAVAADGHHLQRQLACGAGARRRGVGRRRAGLARMPDARAGGGGGPTHHPPAALGSSGSAPRSSR